MQSTSVGKIDDGGLRINYGEGKAIREPSTGKGRYDLITPFGLDRLAKWYELGAKKYADRNWEKGMPFSRYTDSAFRHLNKFIMGMDDEDHLAAAVWNLMCIMHHQELGQLEFDDMPHYKTNVKENEHHKNIENLHEMVDNLNLKTIKVYAKNSKEPYRVFHNAYVETKYDGSRFTVYPQSDIPSAFSMSDFRYEII